VLVADDDDELVAGHDVGLECRVVESALDEAEFRRPGDDGGRDSR